MSSGNQPASSLQTSNAAALSPTVRVPLSQGDRGTVETIARIRKLIHAGMTDQLINRTAIGIVQGAGVPHFDSAGEVRAVYEWVRRNIRFTRDVAGVETLRTAREILLVRAGDCDDINGVLLPSLLSTIGHEIRLVTIASDPREPQTFSHIYCEVQLGGQWIPLDSARPAAAFAKGPAHWYRKRVWSITDSDYVDVKGLGYYKPLGAKRLGDFSDVLDSISVLVGQAGTATANIIRATTPGIQAPTFARNPVTGQLEPVGANGQLLATSIPGGVFTSAQGTIPTWMIFAGFGLLAVMVLKK